MDTREVEDLYGGLGTFDLNEDVGKLKTDNHMLKKHVVSLEEDIEKLAKVVTNLKNTKVNLSKNISSLYLTAKTEIDRKDRMIADLQQRLDNVIFKRTPIELQRKSSDVTANACSNIPKCDESRPYNQGSGNKFERKDNYKRDDSHDRSRDRYSNNRQNTTGNVFEGRHEERKSIGSMRDRPYARSNESLDKYGKKHKLLPRYDPIS